MAALDLLGRRHVLRVVWELRDGPVGFRDLQVRCDGLSPSTLSTRLGELRTAGLVTDDDGRNALTPLGTQLLQALAPLRQWSQDWATRHPAAR
jgi:DNA-binding HxlR family transcriptional regulator